MKYYVPREGGGLLQVSEEAFHRVMQQVNLAKMKAFETPLPYYPSHNRFVLGPKLKDIKI